MVFFFSKKQYLLPEKINTMLLGSAAKVIDGLKNRFWSGAHLIFRPCMMKLGEVQENKD